MKTDGIPAVLISRHDRNPDACSSASVPLQFRHFLGSRFRRWRVTAAALVAGLCLASGAATGATYSDPDYLIDAWETEQGLPENSATAMVQTPDGYLWFGTFSGLVRFDGMKFTVFDPANTPELPSGGIVNLHLDRTGRLWVSTLRGIATLHAGRWTVMGKAKGWTGNYARSFAEGGGTFSVTSFDGKVFKLDGDRFVELPAPPGLPRQGYKGHVDRAGTIWVGQDHFFGYWDGQRWVASELAGAVTNQFRGLGTARDGSLLLLSGQKLWRLDQGREVNQVALPEEIPDLWRLDEDSRGNVWMPTIYHGVFAAAADGGLRHYTATNGLTYNATRFVFEDREKNLWVGTSGGGLLRFKPRRFASYGIESGLPERVVKSLIEETPGRILAGTYGNGLARIERGRVTRVTRANGTNFADYAQCLLRDRKQTTWLGTFQQGLWSGVGTDLKSIAFDDSGGSTIQSLFEDSQGRVWIGGSRTISVFAGGRFQPVTPTYGTSLGGVRCFAEELPTGVVWAGTDEGLFRLEAGQWSEIRDAGGHSLRETLCLHGDTDGTIWAGTGNGSLLRWRAGRWSSVAEAQGLPARTINCLLEDGQGYWWLGSNRGVVRFSRADLEAVADGTRALLPSQVFDLTDGLPSIECTSSSGLRDQQGRLWFGTYKGVAMIDPARFQLNTHPPPVIIENFRVEDFTKHQTSVPLTTQAPVLVPPRQREIAVFFSALSYTAPEKIRLAYRIDGVDREWRDIGARRSLYFFPPEPGTYHLRIKAANNDGVWNEDGATLAFTVQPTLWQTLWFRIFAAGGLLGGTGVTVWRIGRARLRSRIERLEQQRAFEEERTRLGTVMEATSDLVGFADVAGRTLYLNRAGRQLLGLGETEDLRGHPIAEFHPPGVVEQLRATAIPAAIRDGSWRGESTLRSRSGQDIPVSQVLVAHKSPDGTVKFLSTIIRDETESRRAAAALRESERKIRALFDQTFQFMGMLTIDGTLVEANQSALQFAGLNVGDVIGKPFWETPWWSHSAGEQERLRAAVRQAAAGEFVRFETSHPAADGGIRFVDFSLKPARDEQGRVIWLIPEGRDVTERKRVEEELRASETRKRAMLDAALDCIITMDEAGRILEFNPAAEKTFGHSRTEVLGQDLADLIIPLAQREAHRRGLAHYRATGAGPVLGRRVELSALRAEGTEFPVEVSILPTRTEEGKILFTAYLRDLTEQKKTEGSRARLEAQLRQAQKMEAIGTLAGGIAHDFNNILGAIIAYTELARLDADDRELAQAHLGEVLRASERAKNLVRQILTFSRQQQQERRPVSLEPVAREVLQLLRSALPAAIQLEVALQADAPRVLADASQIHQVLMNLCTNAAHALRDRPGTLHVGLDACLVDEHLASTHPGLRPGPYARLTIQDSGHGMDPETLKRIFDPFFTTKGPGEGTGLGLAVVHGIVEEHLGAIIVYSEPNVGTTFKVYFPAHAAAEAAVAEAGRPEPARGTGQRVYYVDDERALGLAAQRILERQGYHVETATDPVEALAVFRARPADFDLVIVDLNMPRMSGLDLAAQILRTRPELPVLLATGFTGAWTPDKVRAAGLRGLVMKPFAVEELTRAVHQSLHGR